MDLWVFSTSWCTPSLRNKAECCKSWRIAICPETKRRTLCRERNLGRDCTFQGPWIRTCLQCCLFSRLRLRTLNSLRNLLFSSCAGRLYTSCSALYLCVGYFCCGCKRDLLLLASSHVRSLFQVEILFPLNKECTSSFSRSSLLRLWSSNSP